MNVKEQIFENTKATILNNKIQFIEAQLSEINDKKEALRKENKQLKAQIRTIKTQKIFKSKKKQLNTTLDSSKKSHYFAAKKQSNSHCKISLFKKRDKNKSINDKQNFNNNTNDLYPNEESMEIKLFELKLQQQYENSLKSLKILQQKVQNLTEKLSAHHLIKYESGQPYKQKKLNPLQAKQNCQEQPKKRKAASVNLSDQQKNFTSQTLRQKKRLMQKCQTDFQEPTKTKYQISLCAPPVQKKSLIANKTFIFGQNKLNESSNSIDHSYKQRSKLSLSRASSSSYFQNNISALNCSKLSNNSKDYSVISTDNYKSYEKIITSIQCEGCSETFKPNLYYKHIENCRYYLRQKLEKQKMQVQEKILNQTMNLSISYI